MILDQSQIVSVGSFLASGYTLLEVFFRKRKKLQKVNHDFITEKSQLLVKEVKAHSLKLEQHTLEMAETRLKMAQLEQRVSALTQPLERLEGFEKLLAATNQNLSLVDAHFKKRSELKSTVTQLPEDAIRVSQAKPKKE